MLAGPPGQFGRGIGDHPRVTRNGLPSRTRPMSILSPTRSRPMVVAQLAVGFNRLPVDGGDDVPGADAGLVGRRSLDQPATPAHPWGCSARANGRYPGSRVYMLTPSWPRFTEPYLISCSITLRAMFTGMAKPMPMFASAARQDRGVDSDQLTAQVSPAHHRSCPGLIEASV